MQDNIARAGFGNRDCCSRADTARCSRYQNRLTGSCLDTILFYHQPGIQHDLTLRVT